MAEEISKYHITRLLGCTEYYLYSPLLWNILNICTFYLFNLLKSSGSLLRYEKASLHLYMYFLANKSYKLLPIGSSAATATLQFFWK